MAGAYEHTLDGKGRLTLPSKLREKLSDTVHVTNSLDGKCLYLFSDEGWDNFTAGISNAEFETATVLEHYFMGNACDCDVDAQGRILLPQSLRSKFNIEKNVTILSLAKRLEIWDTDTWNSFNNSTDLNVIRTMLKESNIRI